MALPTPYYYSNCFPCLLRGETHAVHLLCQVRRPSGFGKRNCVRDNFLCGGKRLLDTGCGMMRGSAEKVQEFISAGDNRKKLILGEVEPSFVLGFRFSCSSLSRL